MSDHESADELTRLEGREAFFQRAVADLRALATAMEGDYDRNGIVRRLRAIAFQIDGYRAETIAPRLEELRREEYRRDALANDLTRPGRDEALEAAMEREAGVKGFDEP